MVLDLLAEKGALKKRCRYQNLKMILKTVGICKNLCLLLAGKVSGAGTHRHDGFCMFCDRVILPGFTRNLYMSLKPVPM